MSKICATCQGSGKIVVRKSPMGGLFQKPKGKVITLPPELVSCPTCGGTGKVKE